MSRDSILWFNAPSSTGPDATLQEDLSRRFVVHKVESALSILTAPLPPPPVVIFFDLDYPSPDDLKLLIQVKQTHPSIPLFLFTTFHNEDLAVWAFRSGVRDYFVKPVAASFVTSQVKTCLQFLRRQRDKSRPRALPVLPIPKQMVVSSDHAARKLTTVCQYIEKHYHQKITLGQASSLVSMSEFQLCRLFKKETGMAFKEYLINYRLSRVETLLAGTPIAITDIACAVGFTDLSNFQRLFRKRNGMTPREFRKKQDSPPSLQESMPFSQENPRHALRPAIGLSTRAEKP